MTTEDSKWMWTGNGKDMVKTFDYRLAFVELSGILLGTIRDHKLGRRAEILPIFVQQPSDGMGHFVCDSFTMRTFV